MLKSHISNIITPDSYFLYLWGNQAFGGIYGTDSEFQSIPKQIGTESSWSQIETSANAYSIFAIKSDGSLWCWGLNGDSFYVGTNMGDRLGIIETPTQIFDGNNYQQVSVGTFHVLTIKTDGSLWAWGSPNSRGELGLTERVGYGTIEPMQIGSSYDWSTAVVPKGNTGGYTGSVFSLAIKTNGTLWSWGNNAAGQLGHNDVVARSSPVQVGTLSDWAQVASEALGPTTSAIKTNGTLWSWGNNAAGQSGHNDVVARSSPVQVGTLSDWAQISASNGSTAAIKNNGTLWTWGINDDGQLGHNDRVYRSSPVQVGTLSNWAQVSLGQYNTYAIKTDGTLWSWGNNLQTELGLGDTNRRSSPVQIGTSTDWLKVTAGAYGAYALKTNGTLWSWGKDRYLQLGHNRKRYFSADDVDIGKKEWKKFFTNAVYGDSATYFGIKYDNSLWAWGNNNFGKLGLGDTNNRSSPTQIGTSKDWAQISVTFGSVRAIKTDGTLWSWGYNLSGDLGHNDVVDKSSPVQVGALSNWAQIGSILALKTDGTLWAWGNNDSGGLGDGTRANRSSPVQIGALNNWAQISYNGSYAIKTDGTLWAWGVGFYGSLGTGNYISRSSPVQIGSDTWKKVVGGVNNTAKGIKTNGTLWTWGYGSWYQHGRGVYFQDLPAPTQIGTDTDWSDVEVSDVNFAHFATKTNGTLWGWGVNEPEVFGQPIGTFLSLGSSVPVPTQISSLNNWVLQPGGGVFRK